MTVGTSPLPAGRFQERSVLAEPKPMSAAAEPAVGDGGGGTTMNVETVVAAVAVLHGSTSSSDQRREADVVLRRWQLTPEAWVHCDQILRDPALPIEARHQAATALRTKVAYDVTQISDNKDLEILCQSLLTHIVVASKKEGEKPVLNNLAVAFADLTIHVAFLWPQFIEELAERLNQPEDTVTLLLCLKVLAEENASERVLADPSARDRHADILKSHCNELLQRLQGIIEIATSHEVKVAALECHVEWVSFAIDAMNEEEILKEPFSGAFYETCIQLLRDSPPPKVRAAVTAVLSEALRECSSNAFVDPQFMKQMLILVCDKDGILQQLMKASVSPTGIEDPLVYARVICDICHGNMADLAQRFHSDPVIQQFILFLLELTDLPVDTPSRDSIIVELMDVWQDLIATLRHSRKRDLSLQSADAVSAAMAKQNELFEYLVRCIVRNCVIPEDVQEDVASTREFLQFRDVLEQTLGRLTDILEPEHVLRILLSILATAPADQAHQEAVLTCISKTVFYLPYDSNYSSEELPSEIPEQSKLDVESPTVVELVQLVKTLGAIIGSKTPEVPIECFKRSAAVDVIGGAADKIHLAKRDDLLKELLDLVGSQVFQASSLPEDQDKNQPVTRGRLMLAVRAGGAFARCCHAGCRSPITQALLPDLLTALERFPDTPDGAFTAVLEGVTVIIRAIMTDEQFLQSVSVMLRILLHHCLQSSLDGPRLKRLDRLSVFLRTLKLDSMQASRRAGIAELAFQLVWPPLSEMLATYQGNEQVVERCCRAMKHLMRCVGGDLFRKIVGPLVERCVTNAKTNFCSTYLYVAEWLGTEYWKSEAMIPDLQTLFDELTGRAAEELMKISATAPSSIEPHLFEDYYGLHCRYLRFLPVVPCRSRHLVRAFELIPLCFRLTHLPSNAGMALSFLETCAHTAKWADVEDGSIDDGDPPLLPADSLEKLRTVFYQHLEQIIVECFKLVASLPPQRLASQIGRVLVEFRRSMPDDPQKAAASAEFFKRGIRAGLAELPPAAVDCGTYKHQIEQELIESPSCSRMIEDLYSRCRRINLRLKEAEL